MEYQLRPFQADDLESLWNIYRQSIQQLGREYYTPEQLAAWSGYFPEPERFAEWLKQSSIYVMNDDRTCIGFAGYEARGRIASLFVHPDYSRQGVASSLLTHLLKKFAFQGKALITTEASELSKPLFERFGFAVSEIEQSELNGITISRYAMTLYMLK